MDKPDKRIVFINEYDIFPEKDPEEPEGSSFL